MDWKSCFKGKKILIVDDDPASQELMLDILQAMHCKAEVAKSGEESIQMVTNGQYDLVLMDMRLPGKSGIETIREIRILEQEKGHLPIIALSGSAFNDPENAISVGIDGWIMKPLHLAELRELMALLLLEGES